MGVATAAEAKRAAKMDDASMLFVREREGGVVNKMGEEGGEVPVGDELMREGIGGDVATSYIAMGTGRSTAKKRH